MAMILVPIFIFVFGALTFDICREESRARAAGMSETTPVCSQCHYPLGSWSSPKCPECGSDIRQVGVRTGPRVSKFLFGMLVFLMALFVVAPLVAMGTGWLFYTREDHSGVEYQSSSIPDLHVFLEAKSFWSRFPPRDDIETSIILTRFLEFPSGGAWDFGHYVGPAKRLEQTVRLSSDTLEENLPRIKQALEKVLDPETDDAIRTAHMQAIETLAKELLDSKLEGLGVRQALTNPAGPLKSFGSVGSSRSDGSSLLPLLLAAAVFFLTIWVGYRYLLKWCTTGWRLPHDREWEYAAPTEHR